MITSVPSDLKQERVLEFATGKISENIPRRLILDGIDADTRAMMGQFGPIFEDNIGGIVSSFYRHVLQFPETRQFFENVSVDYLKTRQVDHWRRMLSCQFDQDYIRSSVAIGLTHYRIGLPLFLYLSGCNRILCDLTSLAIMHYSGALASSQMVSSIIKVVVLDMDITISCYFVADRLRLPTDGRKARSTISRRRHRPDVTRSEIAAAEVAWKTNRVVFVHCTKRMPAIARWRFSAVPEFAI